MRLFRPKVIERGNGYTIIEFPLWATEEILRDTAENIRKDAAVSGKRFEFTIGHRRMRVEEKPPIVA